MTGGDKIELPFSKFVHANGTALAAAIKECWMQSKSIERLPKDQVLVVGGPDYTITKLQNGSLPAPDYVPESTHIHADTRLLLHTNGISIDQEQNGVVIQSSKEADRKFVSMIGINSPSSMLKEKKLLIFVAVYVLALMLCYWL